MKFRSETEEKYEKIIFEIESKMNEYKRKYEM
jgi:hypothetical protein